jgi:uncharacterized protein (AIM24 family)
MEQIIDKNNYSEPAYQLLGIESQTLQLVLMPGQQVITEANSVQYMSEKIRMRHKYTLRERFK